MLKIVQAPDPILATECQPCDLKDDTLKQLAKEMEMLMYASNGVGIAAPQVGISKRLIVIDVSPEDVRDPLVLVNPEIILLQGDPVTEEEGCLSCPGIMVPIERMPWARVRYFDLEGDQWEIEGDGLLARCLQHEIDHLNGRTLFEAAKPSERIKATLAYKEAKEQGAVPGDTSVPKVR